MISGKKTVMVFSDENFFSFCLKMLMYVDALLPLWTDTVLLLSPASSISSYVTSPVVISRTDVM